MWESSVGMMGLNRNAHQGVAAVSCDDASLRMSVKALRLGRAGLDDAHWLSRPIRADASEIVNSRAFIIPLIRLVTRQLSSYVMAIR